MAEEYEIRAAGLFKRGAGHGSSEPQSRSPLKARWTMAAPFPHAYLRSVRPWQIGAPWQRHGVRTINRRGL